MNKSEEKTTKESLLKTLSLLSPWDIELMWDKGLIQKQIKEIESE